MAVRAKFKCVANEASDTEGCRNIRLDAVMSGSPENEQFFRFTPSGQLTLAVVNPAAAEQLLVGQEYYLDLTPAPMDGEIPY